jgi:hypothetical protein
MGNTLVTIYILKIRFVYDTYIVVLFSKHKIFSSSTPWSVIFSYSPVNYIPIPDDFVI